MSDADNDKRHADAGGAADAPTVSVVVPMYQAALYIAECLESLKAQTFTDFEAICVDDGSDDATVPVARATVEGDDRFHIIELPENRGVAAARNAALDLARGTFITFLDADDTYTADALEHIVTWFREGELDELFYNAEPVYESAAARKSLTEDFSDREDHPEPVTGTELFTFFEQRHRFYAHGALHAVRRSLLVENDIRFDDGIIHEDLVFIFRVLVVARRAAFHARPIYRRRLHAGSIMVQGRRSLRNIEGHLRAVRFMRAWMSDHADELDPAFVEAMAHRLTEFIVWCANDYLHDVSDGEKQAYLATLSPAERLEFEFDVIQPAVLADTFYHSRTYRAGAAVTAVPRAIRKRLP